MIDLKKLSLLRAIKNNHLNKSYTQLASSFYSYVSIFKILKMFEEQGLITKTKEGRRLNIIVTPKGDKMLDLAEQIKDLE